MKLTWLGHSCFQVEEDGYTIVIDPYKDGMVPGLMPLHVTAHKVLCSHAHNDHCYVEAVQICPAQKDSPFTITCIESAHDDCGGARRGMNTIHVLEAGGVRIAHLGDLGCALTETQIQAIGMLDALLLPIGGFYTIDAGEAKQVADALSPNVVIPMHYRSNAFGFDALIHTLEDFTKLCNDVVIMDTDTIEITNNMPRQTIALACKQLQR